MTAPDRLEWLLPTDALKAALLAARHGGPGPRLTARELRRRLNAAEASGTNLSVGLYRADRLMGFVLARVDFERCFVSVEDLRVRSSHVGGAGLLLSRLAGMLRSRADLCGLPVRARVPPERRKHAGRFEAALAASGFAVEARTHAGAVELALTPLPGPATAQGRSVAAVLRQVQLHRDGGPEIAIGVIDNPADWSLLEPYWNSLVCRTPGAKVFQTYEFLRAWWEHLGWPAQLHIIVALRDGVPAAIAPMQIEASQWLGREQPCLGFLGRPPESDRPTVLAAQDDGALVDRIAAYIIDHAECWQRMSLDEQSTDSAFYRSLVPRLRAAAFHVSCVEGPACPVVGIRGTWKSYLAARTRGVRKNLKRRAGQLARLGTPGLEAGDAGSSAVNLDRYLEIETASWKGGSTIVGVAQSGAHLSLYRELAARWAGTLGMRFRFLTVGDRTIAATFGLCWQRTLYSLHVAHDLRYASYSPGVLLTALELEEAFGQGEVDTVDFLSGILPNKGSWATSTLPCVNVHVDRDDWRGRHFQRYHYYLKPLVKRAFERLHLLERYRRVREAYDRMRGRRS